MSATERLVRLTAQLYEARRAMKTLYGDRYAERIAEVRPYIEARMEQDGVGEIEAALALINPNADPYIKLTILAAAIEMVEPS